MGSCSEKGFIQLWLVQFSAPFDSEILVYITARYIITYDSRTFFDIPRLKWAFPVLDYALIFALNRRQFSFTPVLL